MFSFIGSLLFPSHIFSIILLYIFILNTLSTFIYTLLNELFSLPRTTSFSSVIFCKFSHSSSIWPLCFGIYLCFSFFEETGVLNSKFPQNYLEGFPQTPRGSWEGRRPSGCSGYWRKDPSIGGWVGLPSAFGMGCSEASCKWNCCFSSPGSDWRDTHSLLMLQGIVLAKAVRGDSAGPHIAWATIYILFGSTVAKKHTRLPPHLHSSFVHRRSC